MPASAPACSEPATLSASPTTAAAMARIVWPMQRLAEEEAREQRR